ncbi:MAG TPA: hypothetical protein VJ813_20300 [Vicinamibacterales bacterium]|nr:hypothetical protein [Vicinamibacterales bacterium]
MQRLPPFAGIVTSAQAQRGGLTVADATAVLHRLAYVKQRLAIGAAAFLPSTPEWEAKCALALHGWIDADHAAAIYARIAEMREPAPGAGDVPDEGLSAALDEALAAPTTSARLGAVYGAIRPAFRVALLAYLERTNSLCDQPTVRVLRAIAAEEPAVEAWSIAALAAVRSSESIDWGNHIAGALGAAGGVDGLSTRTPGPPPRHRRPYRFDVIPARDERFAGIFDTSTPADVVYLDDTRSADERNAALIFKRLREMDVPEVIAGVVAERWAEERNAGARGRPWAYYTSMLRQMWDEARHAMLGQALMESHGVDWASLPVNVTFSWKLAKYCSPVERHILLYAIEQSLMPRDRGKPYEHRVAAESGDRLSGLFHDYDWADEVLHVEIARRCLRPELPGGLTEARERADALWARITETLEREPPPAGAAAAADWWPRFARQVIGRDAAAVPATHVKDWRPGP